MNNRILITGGAGFIGSNLAMELQRRFPDAAITVLDNLSTGKSLYLKGFRGDFLQYSYGDLPENLSFKYDVVFHLAAMTDTRETNQKLILRENIEGFRNLLTRVLGANPNTRVIYASSASVYGVGMGEEALREDMPTAPENPYAFSKQQKENLARLLCQEYSDLSVFGVRFFNVYGRNEGHKFTQAFNQQENGMRRSYYASMIHQVTCKAQKGKMAVLYRDGNQKRDFVHVNDVVDMLISLIDYKGQARIFNCGSGNPRSFNDVIRLVGQVFLNWGDRVGVEYVECPYNYFQQYTCADLTLARQELGFEPKHTTDESILEYIKSI